MNRRGKRLTLGVMAVGLAVILILAIAHWKTVRDHVEAWHFQLTSETETFIPDPVRLEENRPFLRSDLAWSDSAGVNERALLAWLADCLSSPVIAGPKLEPGLDLLLPWGRRDISTETVSQALMGNGWRILEQRLPRRAYVVIRESAAPADDAPTGETLLVPYGDPAPVRSP